MKRVVVESPLASSIWREYNAVAYDDNAGRRFLHCVAAAAETGRNIAYAEACCRYVLLDHHAAPFASHLLYTRMLDDTDPHERYVGIQAGLAFVRDADETWVFTDLGLSAGMQRGILAAHDAGRPVRHKSLPVRT